MSLTKSTLDACLDELPGPIQERIRSWRWTSRPDFGLDMRPQTQGQLGCGGNGCVVVKQAKVSPATGPHCPLEYRAVKIIPVDDKRWKYYLRELDALIRFSDSKYGASFVKFLGWYKFDHDHQLFIITEYCQNGDLGKHLETQPDCRLPESEAKGIIWQVLRALQIMHEEECIHGDIKLSNVLIAQRPPDRWSVKVCDLGLSKRVEQAAGGNASTTIHYSPGYCPPEKSIYDNHENIDGYKVDMWCFGEVVFRILTGKPSFKNVKGMATWCQTGEGYPEQLLRDWQVSEDAIDFLHWVMARKPEDRPTAEDACAHRWWADLDTPPAKGRLALSLAQPRRMSHRSVPDMRFPLEASDTRHASWKPHPCPDHETWSDYAPPYPRRDTTTSGWAASPLSGLQNDPYGTALYQQPYPVSAAQLPMTDHLSQRQRQLESGPFDRQDYDLHRAPHARRLSDDTRPMKSQFNFPELLRQPLQQRNNHEKRAQNTSGSYDGLDERQQQDTSHPKQVRFEDGMHDRSRGSPQQEIGHEDQARPMPAQREASEPDPKGLGRVVALGELNIDRNGQLVHTLVDSATKNQEETLARIDALVKSILKLPLLVGRLSELWRPMLDQEKTRKKNFDLERRCLS